MYICTCRYNNYTNQTQNLFLDVYAPIQSLDTRQARYSLPVVCFFWFFFFFGRGCFLNYVASTMMIAHRMQASNGANTRRIFCWRRQARPRTRICTTRFCWVEYSRTLLGKKKGLRICSFLSIHLCWRAQFLWRYKLKAIALAQRGMVVVSINYRLTGKYWGTISPPGTSRLSLLFLFLLFLKSPLNGYFFTLPVVINYCSISSNPISFIARV